MRFLCSANIGGCVLSLVAGLVNSISYLHFGGFVSHVSGTTTKVGMNMESDSKASSHAAVVLSGFIMGSWMVGCLIPQVGAIDPRRFDVAVITSGIFLCICPSIADDLVGMFIAAAACGLQNSVATTYSARAFAGKFLMRTTHFTGGATDLGIALGRIGGFFLKGKGDFDTLEKSDQEKCVFEGKKALFLVLFLLSFIGGSAAGAELTQSTLSSDPGAAMYIPGSILIAAAAAHTFFATDPTETYKKDLQRMQTKAAVVDNSNKPAAAPEEPKKGDAPGNSNSVDSTAAQGVEESRKESSTDDDKNTDEEIHIIIGADDPKPVTATA